MKARVITLGLAAALAVAPLSASALGTNEKGCLVGGAAGGVVGHAVSGNNTLLGAAIGCGAGVLINKQRVKKEDEQARRNEAENRRHARHDRELARRRELERERVAQENPR
jgi:outer membrane lipoprotein SlyB